MEIIRSTLKVEEQKGFEEIETLVETEVYLDQTKADIGNILWADGKIEILSTKIIVDKMLVNGLIKFKIVYKSNEEELNIYTVEANRDFREEIEIQGITESMTGDVKASLEYIEYVQEDERKVSLKGLIKLVGVAEETNLVEIVEEVPKEAQLETLKERIKYNDILIKSESYALIQDALEVGANQPSIEEVLKVDLHPYEKEYNISADRVILSGIIEYSAIYFGDNKLNSVKGEIPFTHFIDAADIEYDAKCRLNIEVVNGEYEVRENLGGEPKIIDMEVKLKIGYKIYNQKEKEAIIDAYSIDEKINLQMEKIKVVENIKDIIHRESVFKEFPDHGIKEVYTVEANPLIIDNQYVEDKIMVEGLVRLNAYYLDEITNEIMILREEIPFKSYITEEGLSRDIMINTEADLEELKYDLRGNILKVNGIIKNHIFIDRARSIDIVSKIEKTEESIDKRQRPSIIIYIVQKGDILWDIAKRYNTTVDEIIKSNNITSPSTLMPGEKIIIEKKLNMEF